MGVGYRKKSKKQFDASKRSFLSIVRDEILVHERCKSNETILPEVRTMAILHGSKLSFGNKRGRLYWGVRSSPPSPQIKRDSAAATSSL
ncbi:MAG TPA: hypothetical protein DCP92_07140 [Nitrospiraceae bacterium]|nr:hypothetical protein [Nitrospiraceae bacterium]